VSPRLIYPPSDAGLLVGGVGAPHRIVWFIDPAPRPSIARLKPVFDYQRRHPDNVAIQLIVRGQSASAELLRRRFCAARSLGLELHYLRVLAGLPTTRHADPATAAEWLEKKLDNAPSPACSIEQVVLPTSDDEAQRGLPEGIWLDGAAINNTSDVELIELRLRELEASADPLNLVFSLVPERGS
jgi:hypothetical protein